IIFTSLFIAYFHHFIEEYPHFFEGEFGFYLNQILAAQIGAAGVAGLLAFAGLSCLIIAYNIDFKLPERKVKEEIFEEDEDAINQHRQIVEDELEEDEIEVPLLETAYNNRKQTQEITETAQREQQFVSPVGIVAEEEVENITEFEIPVNRVNERTPKPAANL